MVGVARSGLSGTACRLGAPLRDMHNRCEHGTTGRQAQSEQAWMRRHRNRRSVGTVDSEESGPTVGQGAAFRPLRGRRSKQVLRGFLARG